MAHLKRSVPARGDGDYLDPIAPKRGVLLAAGDDLVPFESACLEGNWLRGVLSQLNQLRLARHLLAVLAGDEREFESVATYRRALRIGIGIERLQPLG
jgi:hypothetical protein